MAEQTSSSPSVLSSRWLFVLWLVDELVPNFNRNRYLSRSTKPCRMLVCEETLFKGNFVQGSHETGVQAFRTFCLSVPRCSALEKLSKVCDQTTFHLWTFFFCSIDLFWFLLVFCDSTRMLSLLGTSSLEKDTRTWPSSCLQQWWQDITDLETLVLYYPRLWANGFGVKPVFGQKAAATLGFCHAAALIFNGNFNRL